MEMEEEDSAGSKMMTVMVKTLDSQTHSFLVQKEGTVVGFKNEIAGKVAIPATQQRLIFRGRVLADDKKLSDYGIADSSTIHVVQRAAESTRANDEPTPQAMGGAMDGGGGGAGVIFATATTTGLPGLSIAQGRPLINNRRTSAMARIQNSARMLSRATNLLERLEEDDGRGTETSTTATATASAPLLLPEEEDEEEGPDPPAVDDSDEDLDDEEFGLAVAMELGIDHHHHHHHGPGGGGGGAPPQGQAQGQGLSFQDLMSQIASATSNWTGQGGGGGGINHPPPAGGAGVNYASVVRGPQMSSSSSVPPPPPPPPRNADAGVANSGGGRPQNQNPEAGSGRNPRLGEMADVIDSMLAVHERLVPHLRTLQTILRANRAYANADEQRCVQYFYDTVMGIIHLTSHSHHSLSETVCDFGIPPENRRLTAPMSYLVETSAILRASIPIGAGSIPIVMNQPPSNTATATAPPPTAATANNNANAPQQQNISAAQALGAQISALLGGGQGGGGGGFGIQIDVADHHGGGGAQVGGGGGRQPFNIQDLAGILGGGGLLGAQAQSQQNAPRGTTTNSQQQRPPGGNNNNPTSSNPPMFGHHHHPHPHGNNVPMDPLLICSSTRGAPRAPVSPRPRGFQQTMSVTTTTTPQATTEEGNDWLTQFIDGLVHSNVLPLLRPSAFYLISGYLMRGRDPGNQDHIRSCATNIAKKLICFLMGFTQSLPERNMDVDSVETFGTILIDWIVKMFELTLVDDVLLSRQYSRGIVDACDLMARKMIVAFKAIFKNSHNWPGKFALYLVEALCGSSPILFRENVKATIVRYIQGQTGGGEDPAVMIVMKKNTLSSEKCESAAATPVASSSTMSISPPKEQPKTQNSSSSAVPLPPHQMMDDDDDLDDEMLNLSNIPIRPTSSRSPGGGHDGLLETPSSYGPFNEALRNIPSDWVPTVEHDITRQFGMPDQPPFSRPYTSIFSRKQ